MAEAAEAPVVDGVDLHQHEAGAGNISLYPEPTGKSLGKARLAAPEVALESNNCATPKFFG